MAWFEIVAMVIGAVAMLALLAGGVFEPQRERPSTLHVIVICVLGLGALAGSVAVGATLGGLWFLGPIGAWLVAVAAIRHSAPLRETDGQRRGRVQNERRDAGAERKRIDHDSQMDKAVEAEKRKESLGKTGVGLLQEAERAVDQVFKTEAARDGWLGPPDELDFAPDLSHMTERLLQARRLEKELAHARLLPEPTADDSKMLCDGERALQNLRDEVSHRVKMIKDCARQAREIDRLLVAEREGARREAERDASRRRLAAELYGAEIAGAAPPSDAADAVAAHVAAFRQIKGTVDEEIQREISAAVNATAHGDGGGNPLTWIRRRLRF